MEQKIIPLLHDIKKYLKSKKLNYFEIRFEKTKTRNINLENLSVKDLIENESEGVGIRIIVDEKVGFLSLNKLENYKEEINLLIENTKKTNKKIKFENYSKIKDKDIIKYKSFDEIDNSKKINELIKLNKNYYKKDLKDIKILNSEIIYHEIEKEKYFLTNDSEIYQKRPYIITYSKLTGKKNNKIETSLNRSGYLGGLERTTFQNKEKLIFDNQKILKELLESKPCPATKSELILNPSITNLLAHEAIGHSCEGDALIDNITVLKKGLKISNNQNINIVDNPEIKEFGYFKYDDEGIRARKVELIKKGIVNDFMTDITSATKLKQKSNGSARAQNYNSMPIVRMSNTYFKPGKERLEDMLKGFNGYLLDGFAGGEVDPNIGTFMFGIRQAYKYKNGKVVEKYKQASISGNILTYLNKITEISNKIENFEIGFCGKGGQRAFVSGTGPYLKIENATLGGTKHE
jgi:TldD protein